MLGCQSGLLTPQSSHSGSDEPVAHTGDELVAHGDDISSCQGVSAVVAAVLSKRNIAACGNQNLLAHEAAVKSRHV